MSQHPASDRNGSRSDLKWIRHSSPKLELNPRDRREQVRKARTLENYLGAVSKFKYGIANYVVGTGHRPTPLTDSEEFNAEVLEQWNNWANNPDLCDRAGKNTVYDLQKMASAGECGDGEAIILPQKTANGWPQLLLVDPLLVGSPSIDRSRDVYDGVKTDKTGKILGYYIQSDSDGTGNLFSTKSQFYKKNQVFHLCDFKRAQQLRGRTELHSALNLLHDIVDLFALEIQATKTQQSLAVHVKKKANSSITLEGSLDDVEGATQAENNESPTKEIGKSQLPGASIIEDEEIEEVKLLQSNRPNESLKEFTELLFRQIAASGGWSYEFLCDMSDIGGASARYVLADAYIQIQAKQLRMERQIDFPIYRWWLASMIKLGKFKTPVPEKWWKVKFQFPAKVTMDIKHDGKQLLDLIKSGLVTEEEVFEAQGKSRIGHVKKRVAELKEVMNECGDEDVPVEYYYQDFYKKGLPDEEPQTTEPTPKK